MNIPSYARPSGGGRPRSLLILAAAVLLTPGCDGVVDPAEPEPPPAITELPRALTGAELAAIEASNAFTFDLVREIFDEKPASTVFLSGFSASMALGMTMNGAGGETFEAMRSTLRFETLTQPEINTAYGDLLALLRGLDPNVTLEVGNAVWYRDGLVPRTTFRDAVETHFGARVQGLDFSSDASADTMNTWAAEVTRGKIDRIVSPPIPPEIFVYLMNAVYFEGKWTESFDPARTAEGDFHLEDGSTATVEYMMAPRSTRSSFSFAFDERYSAVDLPYGGGAFSMTVVVPRGEVSLADLVEGLDGESWNDLTANLVERSGKVWLPRFELEWGQQLNRSLIDLGMEPAFDPNSADFTPMFGVSNLFISEVRQKTFVRVDEEGTVAAAVTVVVGGVTSVQPEVRADRPFLFAIRERLSGTILFIGLVVEPPLM